MTLEVNLDLFDMLEVIVPTLGSLMADTNRSEPRIHGVSYWIYPRVLRLATVIDMFFVVVLGLEIKTLVREHQDIAGSDMFIPNMVSPSSGTGPVISLNSGNHLTCLLRKQLEVSTTAWCSKLLKFSMQGPCLHILVPTSWRLQFSELPLPFLGSHWLSSGAFMCFFGWRPPWCDPLTRYHRPGPGLQQHRWSATGALPSCGATKPMARSEQQL